MKRYVVEVSPAQALKLAADQVALAELVDHGPAKLLVCRDRFMAVKAAALSGGLFREGQIVEVVTEEAAKNGVALGGCPLMFEAEPAVLEA